MKAFMHLDSYRLTNASYKTYLFRIAHNLLVNYYRDSYNQKHKYKAFDQVHNIVHETDKHFLWEHMRVLSEVHQHVLRMKYYYGYSVREIAQAIGKSENAIKLHLSRARKQLKEHLHI